MERQDNVFEHVFLHPVSLAPLFAKVTWEHFVLAEKYQVSACQHSTFYELLTGNPQLPAFGSRL